MLNCRNIVASNSTKSTLDLTAVLFYVNNNATTYLPRWLASRLRAVTREARVTVLTGARH
jgi:TATA-box binding protein (TBP) (component of TFIID and TFIIIB)